MEYWPAAKKLLAVEQRKGSPEAGRIRAIPPLFGLLNLIFCGSMDHFIQADMTDHYLLLFLFAETSLIALTAIASFIRTGSGIIRKSTIFPTNPLSRIIFVA